MSSKSTIWKKINNKNMKINYIFNKNKKSLKKVLTIYLEGDIVLFVREIRTKQITEVEYEL